MREVKHVARMEGIIAGILEGKRPFEKSRRRRSDNFKINFKCDISVGVDGDQWRALVTILMNLRVP
jgi:hypothetical protein